MTQGPLEHLNRLIGTWTTEAAHPSLPGLVVHGTAAVEWLEGERFLIVRYRNEHADFPDSISVIGFTDQDRVDNASPENAMSPPDSRLTMHYFDSRGVSRVCEVTVDDRQWRIWRNAPGFSQRFTGTFSDGGDTIEGLWQLSRDDITWDDDLEITYRRADD